MALLDNYLPSADAAAELGVSTRTLARYEREGLAATKVGRRKLYSEKAILDFLAKRTVDRSVKPERRPRRA